MVAALSTSPIGDIIAAGSWGDGVSAPTVAVFKTANGTAPIFTYVTPGT